MSFTAENWIAIAGVIAAGVVGVGGWIFLRPKKGSTPKQTQRIKGGTGYQAGGDIKINDK